MKGCYQFIEGHGGGFMFTLRAGNHETILQSRVCWSRQAALEAVQRVRECSQNPMRQVQRHAPSQVFRALMRRTLIFG